MRISALLGAGRSDLRQRALDEDAAGLAASLEHLWSSVVATARNPNLVRQHGDFRMPCKRLLTAATGRQLEPW